MNVHQCTSMYVAVLLAACATAPTSAPLPAPEPVVRTVTVNVPVPQPCVAAIPAEPDYSDSDAALAALTPDFAGVWNGIALMKGGSAQRNAYIAELRSVLNACVGVAK